MYELRIGIDETIEYLENGLSLLLRAASEIHDVLALSTQDKAILSAKLANLKHYALPISGSQDSNHGLNVGGFFWVWHAGMVSP